MVHIYKIERCIQTKICTNDPTCVLYEKKELIAKNSTSVLFLHQTHIYETYSSHSSWIPLVQKNGGSSICWNVLYARHNNLSCCYIFSIHSYFYYYYCNIFFLPYTPYNAWITRIWGWLEILKITKKYLKITEKNVAEKNITCVYLGIL